jgi:hypothetical protein
LVEFSLSELIEPAKEHDVYLIHNLWAYSVDLAIEDGDGNRPLAFAESRNLGASAAVDVERPTELWAVPPWARFGAEMFVRCPTGRTLVTAEADAEPMCALLGGALMRIGEYLEALAVGSIIWDEIVPPVRFVFHRLEGLPMDFVQTPQLFIASWRTESSVVFTIGVIFLVAPFPFWLLYAGLQFLWVRGDSD